MGFFGRGLFGRGGEVREGGFGREMRELNVLGMHPSACGLRVLYPRHHTIVIFIIKTKTMGIIPIMPCLKKP